MTSRLGRLFYGLIVFILIIYNFNLERWIPYDHSSVTSSRHVHMPSFSVFQPQSEPTCTPKTHVALMKSHKCGSSTIQNILFRYGWRNNLTFALPKEGHIILNDCNPFETSLISDLPWHPMGYDMFVQHVIWNTKEIKGLMPKDTVYVQIIRDPVDLTESLYGYIGLEEMFGMSIGEFSRRWKETPYYKYRSTCFGRNQIVFDFGLSNSQLGNETAVKEKIAEADHLFDLVMIAEYFEESVVLLKKLLCWSLEDVTYLKLNFRKREYVKTLTGKERMRIREMNLADHMYYSHFLDKFKRLMKEYGEEELRRDVEELKKRNTEVYNKCVQGMNDGDKIKDQRFLALGDGAVGYEVHDLAECVPYARNELSFTILLRQIQLERAKTLTYQYKINAGHAY